MEYLQELGAEVARLRRQKGMTQTALASLAGLSQSTLARFETGRVSEFGSRKLLKLMEVLGYELWSREKKARFTFDDAVRMQESEVQAATRDRAGRAPG